jgi:PIN domain nuclease of toxin-antitoxin system
VSTSTVGRVVLDTSALLAFLLVEPGGPVVRDTLAVHGAVMSAVNLAEALSKLAEATGTRAMSTDAARSLAGTLDVLALTAQDGPAVARLRPLTRDAGLSLADRACLALAERLGLPALTTDQAWAGLDVGVTVRLART